MQENMKSKEELEIDEENSKISSDKYKDEFSIAIIKWEVKKSYAICNKCKAILLLQITQLKQSKGI